MSRAPLDGLRILVADGHGHRLDEVLRSVTELGHEIVGQASLGDVAAATAAAAASRPRMASLCRMTAGVAERSTRVSFSFTHS